MKTAARRAWVALRLAVAGVAATAAAGAPAGSRTLWLWDGAQPPANSADALAVVVQHLWLRGDEVLVRPRLSSPRLGPGAVVTPVVHVDLSSLRPPALGADQQARIIEAVLSVAAASTSGWVQLDMEARPSQRGAFHQLVRDLRAALPRDRRLSVTALAWWCRSPAWLDDLAADEVVPMFFRMGRDGPALRALVADAPGRLHPRCRQDAAGFSLQESFEPAVASRYRHSFWFDNRRWRDGMGPP